MNCQESQRRLKHYFEDLLIEGEYQEISLHLDTCASCRQYASSTGSLSYLLKELGDMEVPKDLLTTIRFRMEKRGLERRAGPDGPDKTPPPSTATPVMAAIVCAGIAVVLFGVYIFYQQRDAFDLLRPADKVIGAADHAPAETVPPEMREEGETVMDTAQSQAADTAAGPALAEPAVPESVALHWHIPYFKVSERDQIISTVKILGINPDYTDDDFLIFKATGEQLKRLTDGILFKRELNLNIPDFIHEENNSPQEVSVSVFFRGETLTPEIPSSPVIKKDGVFVAHGLPSYEKASDWHILIIPTQKEALLHAIRKGEGEVIYAADEAVVFKIRRKKVKALMDEIQNLGGVFADFGDMGTDRSALEEGTEKILISLEEK